MNNSDHYFNYIYYLPIRLYSPIAVDSKSYAQWRFCIGAGKSSVRERGGIEMNHKTVQVYFLLLFYYFIIFIIIIIIKEYRLRTTEVIVSVECITTETLSC